MLHLLYSPKQEIKYASTLRCVDPPSPHVRSGNRFQPMHTLIYQNKRLIISQMLTVHMDHRHMDTVYSYRQVKA